MRGNRNLELGNELESDQNYREKHNFLGVRRTVLSSLPGQNHKDSTCCVERGSACLEESYQQNSLGLVWRLKIVHSIIANFGTA